METFTDDSDQCKAEINTDKCFQYKVKIILFLYRRQRNRKEEYKLGKILHNREPPVCLINKSTDYINRNKNKAKHPIFAFGILFGNKCMIKENNKYP